MSKPSSEISTILMFAKALVGAALLFVASPFHAVVQDEKPHQISIHVQVCEGQEFDFWFNEEVADNKSKCKIPLADVPIGLASETERIGPFKTDAHGKVTVGPLAVGKDDKFKLLMGCLTHMCMTLKDLSLADGYLKTGENDLLICTIPQPAGAAAAVKLEKDDSALAALKGVDLPVQPNFVDVRLQGVLDVMAQAGGFEVTLLDLDPDQPVTLTGETRPLSRALLEIADKQKLVYEVPDPATLIVRPRRTAAPDAR